VVALLDARMSEVYTARYDWFASGESGADACWQAQTEVQLMRPEQLQLVAPWVLAGNVFNPDTGALKAQLPLDLPCIETLPTATAMLRLAPNMLAKGLGVAAELALPLYIRDKVAQTTAERAAIKSAA
jgi:tRNA threonylcarbamoyladenosine biosynthesis protein TsaB